MSLRKVFIIGAATFTVMGGSVAMADSLYASIPVTRPANIGYYVEGQVGYGAQDYYSDFNWSAHSGVLNNNNGNVRGGLTGGLDFGYTLNDRIAVELGWTYLPRVNVAGDDSSGVNALPSVYLTSWALYLAAKYVAQLPWLNNTDWFFKVGAAYRRAEVSNTAAVTSSGALPISTGTSGYVRPMFATGLGYSFNDIWSGALQYAYYMGSSSSFPYTSASGLSGSMGTRSVNVITLGVAYKFIL